MDGLADGGSVEVEVDASNLGGNWSGEKELELDSVAMREEIDQGSLVP